MCTGGYGFKIFPNGVTPSCLSDTGIYPRNEDLACFGTGNSCGPADLWEDGQGYSRVRSMFEMSSREFGRGMCSGEGDCYCQGGG